MERTRLMQMGCPTMLSNDARHLGWEDNMGPNMRAHNDRYKTRTTPRKSRKIFLIIEQIDESDI
jgi:hypothetical protein